MRAEANNQELLDDYDDLDGQGADFQAADAAAEFYQPPSALVRSPSFVGGLSTIHESDENLGRPVSPKDLTVPVGYSLGGVKEKKDTAGINQ